MHAQTRGAGGGRRRRSPIACPRQRDCPARLERQARPRLAAVDDNPGEVCAPCHRSMDNEPREMTMITYQFQPREWRVRTPTLVRYMDRQYVEQFFDTGALRLP